MYACDTETETSLTKSATVFLRRRGSRTARLRRFWQKKTHKAKQSNVVGAGNIIVLGYEY